MKLAFWISVGLILYTYLLYPSLLIVLASARQIWRDLRFAFVRCDRRRRCRDEALPTVTLVFAAHNEEAVISQKMHNCTQLEYPKDRLEILVGCDGCSDRTAALARAANLYNARILDFSRRSGKGAVTLTIF